MSAENDDSKLADKPADKKVRRQPHKQPTITAAQARALGNIDMAAVRAQALVLSNIDMSAVQAQHNLVVSLTKSIDTSVIQSVLDMQRSLRSLFPAATAANSMAAYLNSMIGNFDVQAAVSGIIGQIALPPGVLDGALAAIAQNARQMAAGTNFAVTSATLAASLDGTLNAMLGLGLLDSHPLLSESLLAPSAAWTTFVRDTEERIEASASEEEQAALRGSLLLADDQLLQSTGALEAVLQTPADGDSDDPAYSLNVLDVQRDELLTHASSSISLALPELQATSPSAGLARRAIQLASLIVACNESGELHGGDEIFKPTTRMLRTYTTLPWIIVTNEFTLGDFVDCLYWALYEAAGGDSLRFIATGLVSPDDCGAIWHIKDLRNKWLRHDPDHGSESKRKAKWRDLRSTLTDLGLSRLPSTTEEYGLLQRRILAEAMEFLGRLKAAIESQRE
jgi:hypothetical protein